jgi:hypothetical protein
MATPTYLKPEFSYLETCVEYAKNLYNKAGGDASYEDFAKIIGNSQTSSWFLLKVNAMRAYRLIEVNAKAEQVKITQLGEKVAAPNDPDELSQALLAVLCNFPAFKSLAEKYAGKGEPEHQYVENALIKETTLKKEKAGAWASCFIRSAKYAGIFKSPRPIEAALNGIKTQNISEDEGESGLALNEAQQGWLTYPVPVPGGMARIVVPSDLSRPAWEKLKKLLDAIEPTKEGDFKK